ETLMRAAHSIKGAARIINLQSAVAVSHPIEDCLVAAQNGRLQLGQANVDVLLKGGGLLVKLCKSAHAAGGSETANDEETTRFLTTLKDLTCLGSAGSSTAPVKHDQGTASQPLQPREGAAPSAPNGQASNEATPTAAKKAPPQNPVAKISETSERVV